MRILTKYSDHYARDVVANGSLVDGRVTFSRIHITLANAADLVGESDNIERIVTITDNFPFHVSKLSSIKHCIRSFGN